jgi:hypothetical protein
MRLDGNTPVSATERMRSVPLPLALGVSNRFKFGDQPSHLLWHFLLPTFEFVPQGATKRHNRGSPNHNLFFVFFVIHAEVNGTNTASFRFLTKGPWFG